MSPALAHPGEPRRPARPGATWARQQVILRHRAGVIDVLVAPDRVVLTSAELDRLEALDKPALARRWDPVRRVEVLVIGHRYSTTGRVAYAVVDQVRELGWVIGERVA